MNFEYFFFARSAASSTCFATKFLPATNTKPARFSCWEINASGEAIGPKKTVSWNYTKTGQLEQLRAVLGPSWYVLDHFQTLQKIGQ